MRTKKKRLRKPSFGASQLRMGIKVEAEHKPTVAYIRNYLKRNRKLPDNRLIYKHIALNHLKENPKYYVKLKKARL